MRFIADFHIHSKYSRATSKDLMLQNLAQWAKRKGIDIVGTGDFTHPFWFQELREKLEPTGNGLYQLKSESRIQNLESRIYFIPTTEVACIYSRGGKARRVHLLIFSPTLEVVATIIAKLETLGMNLRSDGRPILGIDSEKLLELLLNIDRNIFVIPAHAWTPWFSVFGSESGFDSIEECFGKLSKEIFAIETGLSSDPAMNWRLSALDRIALISCSDAHSLPNLGREATVFEIDAKITPNFYAKIRQILKEKDPKGLLYTIEFFPEEGKYHFDGHRLCGVRLAPAQSKKHNNLCPACKTQITRGVLHRVEVLADRPEGFRPADAIPYRSLVPLQEIIAEAYGLGKQSKKVQEEYDCMIKEGGSEFRILLDMTPKELQAVASEQIVQGIERVRAGRVKIAPGYDGVYGTVKIFSEKEREKQVSLF